MAEPSTVGQGREDVIMLKILVIGKNLIVGHPGAEKLKNHGNWISHFADARLPVAYVGVNGNTVE